MQRIHNIYQLFPSVLSSADPQTVEEYLKSKRAQLIMESQIRVVTLPTLIEEFVPKDVRIDFLNIDVEGAEVPIVSQILYRIHPLPISVCAEANDMQSSQIISNLKKEKYELRKRLGPNLIFSIRDR